MTASASNSLRCASATPYVAGGQMVHHVNRAGRLGTGGTGARPADGQRCCGQSAVWTWSPVPSVHVIRATMATQTRSPGLVSVSIA